GSLTRSRLRGVEVGELLLEVATQLLAVVALELAQLRDPALEALPLAVELLRDLALLRLGGRDDARCLRLSVIDEALRRRLTLRNMLVVETLGTRDDASRRRCGRRDTGPSRHLLGSCCLRLLNRRCFGGRCGGLLSGGGFGAASLELCDARLQLLVLLDRLAPLDDDLVQEVVHLVRVKALLETDVLELFRDDVFRRSEE